jgi:predicted DCC family thiol-disulfide oxidoreductase YuxK
MGSVILVYDQDCGLCRWSVDKVQRWERARLVRAVALQSAEANVLLQDVDPDKRMLSAHVVTTDGQVHSAGALAEPLFRSLPGGRPLAATAHLMPRTTDRIYCLVARNRLRIGGWLGEDACRVDPASRA